MGRVLRITMSSLLAFTIMLLLIQITHATTLTLIITMDEYYNLGESVVISGNLTSDGSPVPDGLVSIQVNDPKGNMSIMRTVPTGTQPTGPWSVEVTEVVPCDSYGNPKDPPTFPRGGYVYLRINLKNNDACNHTVLVVTTLYYSNGIPFLANKTINEMLEPYQAYIDIPHYPIPDDAPAGIAYAYVTTLTGEPKNSGVAWCPEKPTNFTITSGGGSSTVSNKNQETCLSASATPGKFSTTFKISAYGGTLGNYTVYATSWYGMSGASNQTTFEVILITDIDEDGKVSIVDIFLVILAYGSEPGDENWDPRADIDKSGKVNIVDVYLVIMDFGKWGEY